MNFIVLHRKDNGTEIYINIDKIAYFNEHPEEAGTTVAINDEETLKVKEDAQQIYKKIYRIKEGK